jgi:hypothetical protein
VKAGINVREYNGDLLYIATPAGVPGEWSESFSTALANVESHSGDIFAEDYEIIR